MKHVKLRDLEVSRIGLGAMGMSAAYTGAGNDDAESIRTIHRALDLGVTLIDTAEVYGPVHQRGVGRPRPQGPPRRGRGRDQVRAHVPHRRAARNLDSSPANIRDRGRRIAAPARHRLHRPLLPAPRRPEHPDRRDRRGARRTGRRGQGPPHRALRSWADHDPPGARRASRSPRCSRSTRCGPATRSPKYCRCCANSASVSSPTRRSATASSPAPSDPRRLGGRRLAQDEPSVHRRELRAKPAPRRRGCGRRQRKSARHLRRSHSAWVLAQGDDIAPIPGTKHVARVEENTAADGDRSYGGATPAAERAAPRRW